MTPSPATPVQEAVQPEAVVPVSEVLIPSPVSSTLPSEGRQEQVETESAAATDPPEEVGHAVNVQGDSAGEVGIDADLAIVLGKPKKTVKPTGTLAGLAAGRSMLISLEHEGRESAGELSDTSGLKAAYDADRVRQAWVRLAGDLRQKNKVGLAATLANGDFQFDDPTIRFTVANDVQFEEMKECSTELLHFIRTEVGNGAIALDVQVSEMEAPAEFLSPKDRYMNWASDHPSLEVLRKRLDLDLG